jgi:hypothetical protein
MFKSNDNVASQKFTRLPLNDTEADYKIRRPGDFLLSHESISKVFCELTSYFFQETKLQVPIKNLSHARRIILQTISTFKSFPAPVKLFTYVLP